MTTDEWVLVLLMPISNAMQTSIIINLILYSSHVLSAILTSSQEPVSRIVLQRARVMHEVDHAEDDLLLGMYSSCICSSMSQVTFHSVIALRVIRCVSFLTYEGLIPKTQPSSLLPNPTITIKEENGFKRQRRADSARDHPNHQAIMERSFPLAPASGHHQRIRRDYNRMAVARTSPKPSQALHAAVGSRLAILHSRPPRMDRWRIRLPRPVHPNRQTSQILRYLQNQHHDCHHLDLAPALRWRSVLRPRRWQVRAQIPHGSQHDRPRAPPDRHHLQQHLPAIPRRAQPLRTLHGRRLRQRNRNGPRELPRQRARSDVRDPAARLLLRLRARRLCESRGRRLHRIMENGILDRSRLLHRDRSRAPLFPRIETVPGGQSIRQAESDARCVLARDQSDAGQGVAHVHLLHYPDDVVQLLRPYIAGQLHDVPAHAERIQQRSRQPREHPDESRRLRRRHRYRLSLAIPRPPPRNGWCSIDQRLSHPSLDPASWRAKSLGLGLLHAVLRAGRMGRHPNPSQRALPARLPLQFPGYHVPARQHDLVALSTDCECDRGVASHYGRKWWPRRSVWTDHGCCDCDHCAGNRGYRGAGAGEEGESLWDCGAGWDGGDAWGGHGEEGGWFGGGVW